MFFTIERQRSRVYISLHLQGLFKPPKNSVSGRKIAMHREHVFFWCANALHRRQLDLSHRQCVVECFHVV